MWTNNSLADINSTSSTLYLYLVLLVGFHILSWSNLVIFKAFGNLSEIFKFFFPISQDIL